MLTRILSSTEVDVSVIDNLTSLEDIKIGDLKSLLRRDTFLWSGALSKSVQLSGRDFSLLPLGSKLLHLFLCDHVVSVEIYSPCI